jgi:hypothetical protein
MPATQVPLFSVVFITFLLVVTSVLLQHVV